MGSLRDYVIAYKSLGVGVFDYSFIVDSEFFTSFEGTEITGGNCGVEVHLHRSETMLEIEVSIEGEVIVACDRCLEDCPISVDYTGTLVVKFSSEVNDYDGEIMWLSPAESEIDLSQYLYESIVLSLPYQRVHAKGECNAEMIEKFRVITGAEFEAEYGDEESEEVEDAAEDEADDGQYDELANDEAEDEDNIGLASSEIAKLQALKAKMMSEE